MQSSYKYRNGCLTYADGMFYLYSDDGKMVIRELPEEGRSGYLLIADEAGVAGGAEVIVGEHSFRTAEDGSFGLGGSGPGVTRDTLFRVRYRRR